MMMQSNAVMLGSAVMLTTCFRNSFEPVYARHFHRYSSSIPVRHDPYTRIPVQAALTGGHLSSTKYSRIGRSSYPFLPPCAQVGSDGAPSGRSNHETSPSSFTESNRPGVPS